MSENGGPRGTGTDCCSDSGGEDGLPGDVTFQLTLGDISQVEAESSRQSEQLPNGGKKPGTCTELKSCQCMWSRE